MAFYHVSLNGQIVPADEARVSLLNTALLNGFGVYESIEVIGGQPFHLDGHMARLTDSAAMIEMGLQHTADEMAQWASRLTRQLGADCILRVVALGAIGEADEPLVAMLPQLLPRYPGQYYQRGVNLVTYEGSRHLPACKSLNTLVNVLARRHAARAGVHEAVLCSDGRLSEGSRSNIFAVQRGELLTPPADQVLSGITRDIVIGLAMDAGWAVRERSLWLAELPEYDEFFITSTSMHVMPVVAIDDLLVDKGQVGRVTVDLMRRFDDYHRRYFEPAPELETHPAGI